MTQNDQQVKRRSLRDWYQRHVRSHEQELEQARQSAVLKFWLWLVPCLTAIGVVIWLLFGRQDDTGSELVLVGSGLVFVCCIALGSSALEKYKKQVRKLLMPSVIGYFGSDFSVKDKPDWRMSRFEGFHIIPDHDRSSLSEHVKGQYRGITVEATQAHLERKSRDSKGRTRWRTVFNGQIFVVKPPKMPRGDLIVRRDNGLGWFGEALGKLFNTLDKVQLEDPAFEKRFDVYGEDQIDARVILTPSFMQRILDLEDQLDLGSITLSFHGDELLIMANGGKRWFEPGSAFSKVDLQADLKRFVTEVQGVFRIIDTLQLDIDTGI